MAQFDAGSILGTVDLDRDPLTVGLDLAKQQAEDFESSTSIVIDTLLYDTDFKTQLDELQARLAEVSNTAVIITPEIDDSDIEARLIDLQARLDAMADSEIRIVPDIDDIDAQTQLDELQARIDELNGDDINIRANVNTADAQAQLAALKASADEASGSDSGDGGDGLKGLLKYALALAPALEPIAGVAAGIGAGLAGGFAQGAVALGAFAAVAKSDYTNMTTDVKSLATAQAALESATTTQEKAAALTKLAAAQAALTGPIGDAAKAYAGMDDAWQKVLKDTSGPVYDVMTDAFNMVAKLLPEIEPLIVSTADALKGAVGQLSTAFSGPGLTTFLKMIESDIGPDLKDITSSLINFGGGFAKLVEAVNPITQTLLGSIQGISQAFNGWATSISQGGIDEFLDYLKQNGPLVSDTLKTLAGLLVDLVKAIAPAAGPALQFIDDLGQALDSVVNSGALADIATLFGDLLQAVEPLLPFLASLISTILPPLVSIFEELVEAGVGPLVETLVSDLQPILPVIADALTSLSPIIGDLAGILVQLVSGALSIAAPLFMDLMAAIEPLLPIIDQLLQEFEPIITQVFQELQPLLPPINNLLQTLGVFLGDLLEAAAPLIPVFGTLVDGSLKGLVAILTPLLNGISGIVSFLEPLAPIIMGLVVAWGLWTAAMALFDVVADANPISLIIMAIVAAIAALIIAIDEIVTHWAAISGFFEQLYDDVAGFAERMYDDVVGWFERMYDDTAGFAERMYDDVAGFVEQMYDDVVGFFERMYDDVSGWVSQLVNDVVNWFERLPGEITGIFSSAFGWLENAGNEVIQGFFTGIEDAWQGVWNWLNGVGGYVYSFFADAIDWLFNAGEAVINGFWNGVVYVWNQFTSWLDDTFGDVERIIKDVLGIFSPSKVTEQLGIYTAQGFHQGFQNYFEGTLLPYVGQASKDIANAFSPDLSGSTNLTISANAALNTNTSATQALGAKMDDLTNAVKDIPSQTGDAVGASVGGAFVSATQQSTRDIITASRKR